MNNEDMKPSRDRGLAEMNAAEERALGTKPFKPRPSAALLFVLGVVAVIVGLAWLAFH